MVWVLLGPLAPFLREEFALTATQQGAPRRGPAARGLVVQAGPGDSWRPNWRATSGASRAWNDHRAAGDWLEAGAYGRTALRARTAPGNRWRQLCGGTAARESLVSAGISGSGDGHRRRGKLRLADRDAGSPAARGTLRVGDHLRPDDSADPGR